MKKKFLDKQGFAELYKSLKDKFANKGDVPTKVSQLENDKKYIEANKFLESLKGSDDIFNFPNSKAYPLSDWLSNPANISNGDWNKTPFSNGVRLYFSIGAKNSPNGDGAYIVFTSFAIGEGEDGTFQRVDDFSFTPTIVAFHLNSGKIYKRACGVDSIKIEVIDSILDVGTIGIIPHRWDEWEEITKYFVMKDQLKQALSEKSNKSDIPTKLSELTNDKNYIEKEELTSYAKKSEIKELVGNTKPDLSEYSKKSETLDKERDKCDLRKITNGNDGRPLYLTSIYRMDTQYITPSAMIEVINRMVDKNAYEIEYPNILGKVLKNKVNTVVGKQLSSNDYTNEDRNKLQAIPIPTFLEKEQYDNLSKQGKMDNSKLYYVYVERKE